MSLAVPDVRRLSRSRSRQNFVTHSFEAPGIGRLPEPNQALVFDMYVNAGAQAVRILQRLLNDMGHGLAVDGRIGPLAARAANQAHRLAPRHLVDASGIARRNYHDALADRRSASRKYARRRVGGKSGWIVRAEEFIHPRFDFSEAEHRARVAAWA